MDPRLGPPRHVPYLPAPGRECLLGPHARNNPVCYRLVLPLIFLPGTMPQAMLAAVVQAWSAQQPKRLMPMLWTTVN